MGVQISDELVARIREIAAEVHHGRIILEINTDKPDRIDLLVEYRERFRGPPPEDPGLALSRARVMRQG